MYYVGIIGMIGMVKSGVYEEVLKFINNCVMVESLVCLFFVEFVESGNFESEMVYEVVREML